MYLLDAFPVISMAPVFEPFLILLSFLIFSSSLSAATPCPPEPPILDFGYAKYQGLQNSSVNTYYGIRYASPPVDSLRWQPPLPIEQKNNYSSSTVIDATIRGPQCWQGDQSHSLSPAGNILATQFPLAFTTLLPSSEDCLVMDIFLPAQPISDKLPVVVNFHGGGNFVTFFHNPVMVVF